MVLAANGRQTRLPISHPACEWRDALERWGYNAVSIYAMNFAKAVFGCWGIQLGNSTHCFLRLDSHYRSMSVVEIFPRVPNPATARRIPGEVEVVFSVKVVWSWNSLVVDDSVGDRDHFRCFEPHFAL